MGAKNNPYTINPGEYERESVYYMYMLYLVCYLYRAGDMVVQKKKKKKKKGKKCSDPFTCLRSLFQSNSH